MNRLGFAAKRTIETVNLVRHLTSCSSVLPSTQKQSLDFFTLNEVVKSWADQSKMPNFFYAVNAGIQPGVYLTWDECKKQVDGYSGAKFKKFQTMEEANSFVMATAPSKPTPQAATPLKRKLDLTRPPAKKFKSDTSENVEFDIDWKAPEIASPHDLEPVVVYTDGACPGNGKKRASGGIGVYWGPAHALNVSEPLRGRQTNNRAEIMAAVKAICQARKIGKINVTVRTDSKFLINAITTWIKKWKRNGWTTGGSQPVINKEDFQILELALDGMNITWEHVRGHHGVLGNEMADKLAVAGVRYN